MLPPPLSIPPLLFSIPPLPISSQTVYFPSKSAKTKGEEIMIKSIVLELNGKVLSEQEINSYICVSKVVSDTVNQVYDRFHRA